MRLPQWAGRAWALIAAAAAIVAGVVGFLSSSIDLGKFFTEPMNDTDVFILPDTKDTIGFDSRAWFEIGLFWVTGCFAEPIDYRR